MCIFLQIYHKCKTVSIIIYWTWQLSSCFSGVWWTLSERCADFSSPFGERQGMDPKTMPSEEGTVCLAASRGLQRFTVVLLIMNGLASPRGISPKPLCTSSGSPSGLNSSSSCSVFGLAVVTALALIFFVRLCRASWALSLLLMSRWARFPWGDLCRVKGAMFSVFSSSFSSGCLE